MNERILYPEEKYSGARIDTFLSEQSLGLTRSGIKNLIEKGQVLLNGKAVKKAGAQLKAGDTVSVLLPEQEPRKVLPQNIPIEIIYQDEDLAVINKAQGMVTHPAAGNYQNTLVNALLYHIKELSSLNGELRPGIVHRLDKDTSGLLIIAKNNTAHIRLAAQIKARSAGRYYTALLHGRLKEDEGEIKTEIGRSPKDRKKMAVVEEGREAVTSFKVLQRFDKFTLAEFKLQTGRTHQIRVHAKYIGHPVAGDRAYGPREHYNLRGQLLHAGKIEFTHPATGERMSFTSDLPPYFAEFLAKLRKQAFLI
ncbi:MAG: RluA family pseudouridine synthase [Christensenellales bacterium]|jgi:23S rRNA pseudouridine1911/1915/1917 synthase